MRTLAIEINDASLVVADAEGVLAVEPGYALVDDGGIKTGIAAYAEARLKPRRTSNRYWANLSMEPGSAGVDGVGSAAELAFRQLRELWERVGADAEAVFVVPGHYAREQLGVILGLAQECRIPVRALVNAAVAASSRPYPGRQLIYVDAGLHRVSVTALEQGDEVVARPELGLETTGLGHVVDTLVRWFAEIFVRTTRLDPLRHATTEQRLYDCLPAWLRLLREDAAAELSLLHGEEEFRVKVEREQLLGVLAGFNRALVQLIAQAREPDAGLVVQVSQRLADLPGLTARLARLEDAHIVHLPEGHAARAALAGLDALETGGQVKLLKHLPWREAAYGAEMPVSGGAQQANPEPVADAGMPTHVVYNGVAYPITGDGLLIGRIAVDGRRTIVVDEAHGGLSRSHCELVLRDGEPKLRDLSRHGTFVNERRVNGEVALKTRDVIRIGSPGVELAVIRVEDAHAPA